MAAHTELLRKQVANIDFDNKISADTLALNQRKQDWAESQALYARAVDDKNLLETAKKNLFDQQSRIADIQSKIADNQARRQEFQSQIDWNVQQLNANALNEAARFNAQMGFNVEQANIQAEQQKQAQLQSLASSIAEAAKSPGDYGKLAALTLANTGWGAPATAIGRGADVRTTESLAPLESELRTRRDVMARPDRPYTFTPIQPTLATAPTLGPLDLSKIKIPTAAGEPGTSTAPGTVTPVTGATNTPNNLISSLINAGANPNSAAGFAEILAKQQNASQQSAADQGVPAQAKGGVIPRYATGGYAPGAYISGERGPELNIPLGDQTLILNQKQLKAAGIDLKKLMSGYNKPKQFADGGVFNTGWGNVQDQDRTLSMQFLNDALERARAGTPWQSGPLPTPIYTSSPGFSPIVSQTLGSLTAMAQGIPQEYFQELAAKYAPSGMTQGFARVGNIQRTA